MVPIFAVLERGAQFEIASTAMRIGILLES